MQSWLLVALGGAVGACLRFALSELMILLCGRGFPYGTLLVNSSGSFVMGIAYALITQNVMLEHPLRPLLMVGLLGALTTFSSFALDTLVLFEKGFWLKAVLNVLLNFSLSLLMVWLGTLCISGSRS